jgi:protein MpaA
MMIERLLLSLLVLIAPAQTAYAQAETSGVDALCDYLGARLKTVSVEACRSLAFQPGPDLTKQGHPLVHRDFEAVPGNEAGPPAKRILVIGGIHGDELTSISIVFRWLEWLGQPEAAIYTWRIIPLANPDGLKARPSTRVNANGVDLNRNFQTPDWDKEAQAYWIKRTKRDPRRNPGTRAGSEIETRWLQAQIDAFRPDLIISIHAPYNLLDYDGPVPKPLRFGRLTLNKLGAYPGSLGNYGGLFKQIPVITIELPNATSMPAQRDQQTMWRDMLVWIKNSLKDSQP